MAVSSLCIGKAAEHLVCVDLLLRGYNVSLTNQGFPYDLIVDTGANIYRVQVKARSVAKRDRYRFKIAHGCEAKPYKSNQYDILALVAIDNRQIAYIGGDFKQMFITIRSNGVIIKQEGTFFSDYTLEKAMKDVR